MAAAAVAAWSAAEVTAPAVAAATARSTVTALLSLCRGTTAVGQPAAPVTQAGAENTVAPRASPGDLTPPPPQPPPPPLRGRKAAMSAATVTPGPSRSCPTCCPGSCTPCSQAPCLPSPRKSQRYCGYRYRYRGRGRQRYPCRYRSRHQQRCGDHYCHCYRYHYHYRRHHRRRLLPRDCPRRQEYTRRQRKS